MTLRRAFIEWMEDQGLGVFGTNIFTQVPDSPAKCWWVLASGGSSIQKNTTGEKLKNYVVSCFYRSDDGEDADNVLHSFEELVNDANCEQLSGFDTVEMEATSFPADQDLDSEDRVVGLVQITITTHR
jgi:hypothetical protein